MASSTPDQSVLLKEVLGAVKSLQINQVQLASSVDAIAGRVNVLAGMKEVRDVATGSASGASSTPVTKLDQSSSSAVDESHPADVPPESPSLPATQFPGSPSQVSHAKKPSVTSRIILT